MTVTLTDIPDQLYFITHRGNTLLLLQEHWRVFRI